MNAITLTFNENVQSRFSLVKVLTPSGSEVQAGPPAVVDATVTQPLAALPENGEYQLSYRIVSADGHPVSGSRSFEYTGPVSRAGPVPAQPQAQKEEAFFERHASHILIPAAVVALLGLAGVFEWWRKKR